MRILLLADINSAHTLKWVRSLTDNGIDIHLVSLTDSYYTWYRGLKHFQHTTLGVNRKKTDFFKIGYLGKIPLIKRIIKKYQPDLIHSHYASSYGLLAARLGFHPLFISVWGSDVFVFPKKSIFHRASFKQSISKADKILSTSEIMASEIKNYTKRQIDVLPFGIDLQQFKPTQPENSPFGKNDIVIGAIKSLEPEYGTDTLIRAFRLVKDKLPDLPLKLLLVGGGSLRNELETLVGALNLEKDTVFEGRVDYDRLPHYHNILSIFVNISIHESFGVSVLEASACEKAIVVTNVGGLAEIMDDGQTALLVPPRDVEKTAASIIRLIKDEELRKKLGARARKKVEKFYNWNESVEKMIVHYQRALDKKE